MTDEHEHDHDNENGHGHAGGVTGQASAVAVAVLALSCASCASTSPRAATPSPPPAAGSTFDVAADAPELQRTPALLERLHAGPHSYFRFMSRPFARLACERFADLDLPHVTLHGDAHIEQYAVTDLGRGLTDFDDSSSGPAIVDLLRFGTSLRLAARERGWDAESDRLWGHFWSGYERALLDPGAEAPEPTLARRLQAGFESDRLALLARAEALMAALPEPRPMLEEEKRRETVEHLARNSGLPVSFFKVKKAGALDVGIGSAADEKYLFRVDGETTADDDDVLLEFKEIRDLGSVPCIRSEPGPTRILLGQSRLAYQPFRYTGAVHSGDRNFWVHSWPLNYVELRISELRSAEELAEVVYDVGVQLGRGHPKHWSSREAQRLRERLARGIPRKRVAREAAELADEIVKAWQRFCDSTRP